MGGVEGADVGAGIWGVPLSDLPVNKLVNMRIT